MSEAGVPSTAPDATPSPHLPQTFGEKFAYMAPLLAVNFLASVAVAFGLVWVISGSHKTEAIDTAKNDIKEVAQELRHRDAETEKLNSQQQKAIDTQMLSLDKLNEDKEALKDELVTAVEKVGLAQTALDKQMAAFESFVADQTKTDSNQNATIGENSKKIVYIERRLEKLNEIESEVMALKNDTGDLKGQYATLKTDLTTVREKGEVTDKELTDLTERARLFQLRVLRARAREAAEEARKVDLKKMLARLTDDE